MRHLFNKLFHVSLLGQCWEGGDQTLDKNQNWKQGFVTYEPSINVSDV